MIKNLVLSELIKILIMRTLKQILTILFLTTCLQVSAQSPKNQAKEITDKMTEVLSLSKNESEAIYKIQLSRFKESDDIKKKFEDDPETRKEKLKELGNKVFNELKNTLGKEKLQIWNEYKSKKNS